MKRQASIGELFAKKSRHGHPSVAIELSNTMFDVFSDYSSCFHIPHRRHNARVGDFQIRMLWVLWIVEKEYRLGSWSTFTTALEVCPDSMCPTFPISCIHYCYFSS